MEPSPRAVYDDPESRWAFLTQPSDDEFEGQHFERKEAGRRTNDARKTGSRLKQLREDITETVSAFANSNVQGGLLVIGIASNGDIHGVNHLTEEQKNSLTDIGNFLHNQAAEAKFCRCTDIYDQSNVICLIFAPYADRGICETPGPAPRAWERRGPQNVLITSAMRDRLRDRKNITDFENTFCSPYDRVDLSDDILAEFRKVFVPGATGDFPDERLLYEAGALVRRDGAYWFTHSGLLFFGSNPQRVLSASYIRLLRFGVIFEDFTKRGLPTFDQKFTGPVTKQIREARTFFRESAFFKRYQKRRQTGGFVEEPEFPPIVIDEAIVNAVAHRDYRTQIPIECEAYTDAFVVRNPGRMMQRDADLPPRFSLAEIALDSTPRNPKLLEWLKLMRDPSGVAYVQAVSEGTKRMVTEMEVLGLPAPSYRLASNETLIKIESRAEEREAAILAVNEDKATEFSNLFLLGFRRKENPVGYEVFESRYGEVVKTLRDALKGNGWHIDSEGFSRILAHRRGNDLDTPLSVRSILRFYPAYEFQIRQYHRQFYLCIDYRCLALNIRKLVVVKKYFAPCELEGCRCMANSGGWREGQLSEFSDEFAKVRFFDTDEEETVPVNKVIPVFSRAMLESMLKKEGSSIDLAAEIRKRSLVTKPDSARERAEKTLTMVEHLSGTLFPLRCFDLDVDVASDPVRLSERRQIPGKEMIVHRLPEPKVEFRQRQLSPDVRAGITKYGAYGDEPQEIELVPVCHSSMRKEMEGLIARLIGGRYKYLGSERTFATKFSYSAIVTVDRIEDIQGEIERLLSQRPGGRTGAHTRSLFLVHTPEDGYSQDDHTAPYYVNKRLLLERGAPCQMVDTPTLRNADWKDLNLALNICAKCGVRPWVLPDAIPEADFFVGLSYTQSVDGRRIMGFASVFNSYGRWEFYRGNKSYFDYEARKARLAGLVEETLTKLGTRLSLTPRVVFQYSAKFSRIDREAILRAARKIRPEGIYNFVSINSHHNVRFYDRRPDTDGSLRRGSYVEAGANKIFLSTTGYNPFRRMMGTPKPLEISAWIERPGGGGGPPDLRVLALQVLSLTKLNWASTDAFCGEPITVKYARDIAYLTAAFLRQSEPFDLHPSLEETPWFI